MEKLDFDACSCKTKPLLKLDSFQKTLEKKIFEGFGFITLNFSLQ